MRKNLICLFFVLTLLSTGLASVPMAFSQDSQTQNIKILNYNYYIDNAGFLDVVGEVQNIGSNSVNSIILSGSVFSSHGMDQADSSTQIGINPIPINYLNSGQKAPFYMQFFQPKYSPDGTWKSADVSSIKLVVTQANATTAYEYPDLMVTNTSSFVGNSSADNGVYWVTGNIENTGNQTAQNVTVFGTFYNIEGSVVAVGYSNQIGIIDSSGATPFNLGALDLNQTVIPSNEEIASYSLLIETLHPIFQGTGSIPGPTQVNGIISSDTIWSQIGSPYNLTGNVLVNNGVILTIEPGVIINLNNYYLMVNGTLVASGNSGNSISFGGGQLIFTTSAVGWSQSTGLGSIIQNADLNCSLTISDAAKITEDMINSAITVQGTSNPPIFSNNIIKGGISIASDSSAIITNNTIIGQGISMNLIVYGGNTTIVGNIIYGCSTAIAATMDSSSSHTVLIESNLIINNSNGIKVAGLGGPINGPIILNNTITNNAIGLYISASYQASNQNLSSNNIYNNINYNIENQNPMDINASNNWWGSTDTQAISQTIYDVNNDYTLGKVTFLPILTAPNYEAPTYIVASIGDWGTINPNGYVSVNYGGNQSFNITANTGYHISDVSVDNVSQGAVSSYTFTNVQSVHAITATFAINTFTISASAGENGTITPSGNVSVNFGSTQNFNITAYTGYHIANVIVDNTSQRVASSYIFSNVTSPHTIIASFAINTYVITVLQNSSGVISPGTNLYNYGDKPSFTVTPDSGYYISNLRVDGASVLSSMLSNNYIFPALSANHTVVASFALTPTSTSVPSAAPTPSPTPKPNPLSTPSPTQSSTTVAATTDTGSTVNLAISGNITGSQMSNVTISTNQSATTTTLSFTVTGQSGTTSIGNVTIPKSSVPYGTTPTIYIDGQTAQDQGFTQDSSNYYVWYTTHFSTHEISIVFTASFSIPEYSSSVICSLFIALAISVISVLMLKKPKMCKN